MTAVRCPVPATHQAVSASASLVPSLTLGPPSKSVWPVFPYPHLTEEETDALRVNYLPKAMQPGIASGSIEPTSSDPKPQANCCAACHRVKLCGEGRILSQFFCKRKLVSIFIFLVFF